MPSDSQTIGDHVRVMGLDGHLEERLYRLIRNNLGSGVTVKSEGECLIIDRSRLVIEEEPEGCECSTCREKRDREESDAYDLLTANKQ